MKQQSAPGRSQAKPSGIPTIQRADDPSISCYSHEHYNDALDRLKSKALGWFVQFAIRRDLNEAWNQLLNFADFKVQLSGYVEIYSKARELNSLIREKHVIDEADLVTIGLSIYSFPTLATFFVNKRSQSFVREATAQEIATHIWEMREIVENSELIKSIPNAASIEEGIGALTGAMTRTQIELAAGLSANKLSKERLLLVDMAAPVTILKAQFLAVLERSEKQKSSIELLYKTWHKYGILPYIDLNEWSKREAKLKVPLPIQAELIYRLDDDDSTSCLYEKTVTETTEPHAARMLDPDSQPFRALIAAASSEFQNAIQFARGSSASQLDETAEEALHRWFPATYPYNMSDLKRTARLLPEQADQFRTIVEEIERSGRLTLTVKDRIRDYGDHGKFGSGVLEFIKAIGQAPEVSFLPEAPQPLEETLYYTELEFADALRAFEEAERASSMSEGALGDSHSS